MAVHTTSAVAEKFNTDTRTLRKFLRADAKVNEVPTPGKGSRWTIEGKELASLKKRFKAWSAATEAAKVAKAEVKAQDNIELTAEDAMEDHLQGMGEDREPTDEELDAMQEVLDQD